MRTAPCTWCLPSRCNRPPLWLFAFQKGHRTINQGCAGSVVLRHVCLFDNAWVIAHQAPLSRGFSRKAYWSMLPCPSPRDLPTQGSNPQGKRPNDWEASSGGFETMQEDECKILATLFLITYRRHPLKYPTEGGTAVETIACCILPFSGR